MFIRRSLFLFMLIATCGLRAQTPELAPDSLSGYSYYYSYSVLLARNLVQSSIELNADGTYVEHWNRTGRDIDNLTYGVPGNFGVPVGGSYSYTKQSDSQGLLTLNPSGGSPIPWTMIFTAVNAGQLSTVSGFGGGAGGSFTLQKLDAATRPLVNISTLVHVHSGESTTAGFVVSHAGDYLIRVAGPALTNLGITNPWANPAFFLYFAGQAQALSLPSTGIVSVYSQPWDSFPGLAATNTQAFPAVGAFAFPAGSKDAAAVVYLVPGAYTMVVVAPATDPGGTALIEVYNYQ